MQIDAGSVEVEAQIAGFIDKFAEPMQVMIRDCRARLEKRFPQAIELIYDNYNFLVVGFGPTTRSSDSILSLACFKNGVNLCFLQRAPELPDPTGILRGSGRVVRNVALSAPDDLERADVAALIDAELALARVSMQASAGRQVIVKSVSARQRPRR